MSKTTKLFAKGGIATAAVGAMALAGASPVQARDSHRDGIDAGDIIAGAVILGGIAAVASTVGKDRSRYDYRDRYGYRDRDYRSNRYGHGNARAAVQRCVAAVERDARRAGYRFAQVTEIRDVDRERRGWEVKGRLIVDGNRGWAYRGDRDRYRDGNRYHDRRYDYGYNSRHRADSGKFKCEIRRGRVEYIDYSGIRGLR
ncbi:hypothetical protein [Altererythrobacter sp.]|uniref:hypothetical protein n=1 Tax=Altererythrobacter sp. TaxID=1872480 RepID=UPI003D031C5D